jgi:tripartite-type tricarboxylate transporter receptor subunit TctC
MLKILLLLVAALAVPGAHADSWPSRPVTLVVGTPAGGAVDAYARIVAAHMSKTLGQTVIIENKPGANGNISAEQVARAAPDGYTLWVGTQSMTEINPSVFSNLRWSMKDFVPIIKGVEAPLVLVTNAGVPPRTLAELKTWLEAHPDQASYGSFSPGTPSHFLGHQLGERLGIKMTHVPFKGSAPQVSSLIGGHVPFGFSQIQTTLAHIQAGRLHAIAVTDTQRWRQLPEVPTFAELGFPDLTATIWFGLLARTGTPAPVLAKLSDAAVKAHADPDVKQKLEEMGFNVPQQAGKDFAASIRAGTERWATLVKATGFTASN